MDVKIIECKLIDVPKALELRTFKKDFAFKLADSIRAERMYNAIVARPNPSVKGRYLLVQGRHRLYAKKTILKEQFIECNVMEDMDDEDAEMAMISENLFRNPLTKSQHVLCIKKWFDLYAKKHPEKVRTKGNGSESLAAVVTSEDASGDSATETQAVEATKEEETKEETVGNFAEHVAAATGESLTSVKRKQKLATSFTEDELEIFNQLGTSQTDMLTIAAIKDEAKRGAVVNLVAAGMDPSEAIKTACKDGERPVRRSSLGKAAQEEKDAANESKSPDLTDEEWFTLYCGEKAKCFAQPDQFKRDSILFRHIIEPRHNFRTKIKKLIKEEIAKPGRRPVMANLLNRVIAVAHPKDWLVCEKCKGKGEHAGKICDSCYGAGYKLKLEEYL